MAEAQLLRESRVFGRYLTGVEPAAALQEAYARGCAAVAPGPAGAWLVAIASTNPLLARCADAYSRVAAPASTLRRRLVLLAAILESSATGYRAFEQTSPGSFASVLARLAASGIVFSVALLLGLLVLGPIHLFRASVGRR